MPTIGSPAIVVLLAIVNVAPRARRSRSSSRPRSLPTRWSVGVVVVVAVVGSLAARPGAGRPAERGATSRSQRRDALRLDRGRDRVGPGRPDQLDARAVGRRHVDDAADRRREADADPAAHRPAGLEAARWSSRSGWGPRSARALIAGLRADVVELVPSVPDMFGCYYPDAAAVLADPNGRVIIADGRNHLELATEQFDIIVTDPPPPIESSGASVISSLRVLPGRARPPDAGRDHDAVGPVRRPRATSSRTTSGRSRRSSRTSRSSGRGRLRRLHARVRASRCRSTPDAIREVLARPGVLEDISSAYDSPATTVDDWIAGHRATSTGSTTPRSPPTPATGPLITDDHPRPEYFLLRRLSDGIREPVTSAGTRADAPPDVPAPDARGPPRELVRGDQRHARLGHQRGGPGVRRASSTGPRRSPGSRAGTRGRCTAGRSASPPLRRPCSRCSPSPWCPETVAVVAMIGLGFVGTAWALRRLGMPLWWLAFPPFVDGLYNGNPQVLLIPLLVAGLAPIAALVKIYAVPVPLLRGEWKAVAAAAIVLLVTIPILPWGTVSRPVLVAQRHPQRAVRRRHERAGHPGADPRRGHRPGRSWAAAAPRGGSSPCSGRARSGTTPRWRCRRPRCWRGSWSRSRSRSRRRSGRWSWRPRSSGARAGRRPPTPHRLPRSRRSPRPDGRDPRRRRRCGRNHPNGIRCYRSSVTPITLDAEPACPAGDDHRPRARCAGRSSTSRRAPAVRRHPAATWDALAGREPVGDAVLRLGLPAGVVGRLRRERPRADARDRRRRCAGRRHRDAGRDRAAHASPRGRAERRRRPGRTLRGDTDADLTPVAPDAKAIFFGASYHADYATILADAGRPAAVAAAPSPPTSRDPPTARPGTSSTCAGCAAATRRPTPSAAAFGAREIARGLDAQRRARGRLPGRDAAATGVDFDGYLATLGKKERHEIRRKVRRAEAAGEIRLDDSTDPLADLDAFIDLHQGAGATAACSRRPPAATRAGSSSAGCSSCAAPDGPIRAARS